MGRGFTVLVALGVVSLLLPACSGNDGFEGRWTEVEYSGDRPDSVSVEAEGDHYLWIDDDGNTFVARVDEEGILTIDFGILEATAFLVDGDMLVRAIGEEHRYHRETAEDGARERASTATNVESAPPASSDRNEDVDRDAIEEGGADLFGATAATDLQVGDCYDTAQANIEVSCEGNHSHEVFGLIPWTKTNEYPTELEVFAEIYCEDLFEAYVGIDYFESDLWYETARPSESAWNAGDFDIRCVLYEPGASLDRSEFGSAR